MSDSPNGNSTTTISGFKTLIQTISNIQQALASIVVTLKQIAASL